MTMLEARPPVTPGEPAPDFTLPAVDRNENVSLADYRGRSPVFLALMVGLWCPFCRRQIAQIGTIEGKLKALGVESLAVVATPPENARLYFKFRPTRVRLASDPELSTHRAYGIPRPAVSPELMEALGLAEQAGEPQLLFPCYDGLATLHLDTGNQALAEKYLAKAQEVCERAGLEPDTLMVLPFLC